MPDPIDELEDFTMTGVIPPPPSEVRRRGDRIRRRNNALAAVGGVAAVTLIAVPVALFAADNRTDSSPQPARPSPSVTWVQEIPADFPLAAGLPRATTSDSYEQQAVPVCADAAWTPGGVDVRQAVQTESEGGWDRTVAVYATEDAASLERTQLAARVEQCAAATDGKARSTEVVDSGADALVYVDHLSGAGDMYAYRVLQVGNALLVDTTNAMGGGDPAVVQATADLIEEKSTGVVDAMCVFSADPC